MTIGLRLTRLRRFLGYLWASPCSAIGLLAAAVVVPFGASIRLHAGVIEVAPAGDRVSLSRMHSLFPYSAITFGHVVLGRSAEALERLRDHERVHVAQYERWGVVFFLAYPLSSLLQVAHGRHAYRDNRFEVLARNAADQVRSLREA